MKPLTMTFARSIRTQPLLDGRVTVAGARVTPVGMPTADLIGLFNSGHEFDIVELAFGSYLQSSAVGDSPYVALPIFPARSFPLGRIYVRSDSDIHRPSDLAGKVAGLVSFPMTAVVWMRGILEEFYGLPHTSVMYRTVGGPTAEVPKLDPLDALLTGGIDAFYAPRVPDIVQSGDPRLRSVFAHPLQAEAEYYRTTGIVPILHVMGIRRELIEDDPSLAGALGDAFAEANRIAEADIFEYSAVGGYSPFGKSDFEATEGVLGANQWSQGLGENLETLDVLARYMTQQSLLPSSFEIRHAFAAEAR